MAKTTFCIWELQAGVGTTTNGGGFDPSLTASMDAVGSATSANTASPVFSSANYSFVAGDVGAYVYIASGTNWIQGFYKIASVAGGNATLTGACATVASPTSATWSVDYSRQPSPALTVADGITNGTTLLTSVTGGFNVNLIGNALYESGTAADRYFISAVPTANNLTLQTATADTGSSITVNIGGALGTGDIVAVSNSYSVQGNVVYVLYETTAYTIAAVSNTPGGDNSGGTGRPFYMVGYSSDSDRNIYSLPANRPTLKATGSTIMIGTPQGHGAIYRNLIFDQNSQGNNVTQISENNPCFYRCSAINVTGAAFGANYSSYNALFVECDAALSGSFAQGWQGGLCIGCSVSGIGPSSAGFVNSDATSCVARGSSNANGTGFSIDPSNSAAIHSCVAYDLLIGFDARPGFAYAGSIIVNCLANTCGTGFNNATLSQSTILLLAAAAYGCTTDVNSWNASMIFNGLSVNSSVVHCTVDPCISASTGNFTLNSTAGGGALLQGMGFGFVNGFQSYQDIGAIQSKYLPVFIGHIVGT